MPGPVFLRGETVDLHTVEVEDLPFLQRLVNDPRVRETLGSVLPYTEVGQREWYDSLGSRELPFLVCVDGEPVGYVELEDYFPAWSNAEVVGYLDPEHWGNGYATAAAELLVGYAFDTLGLDRLYAHAQASNSASRAVLERVGFHEEGRLREHAYVRGERVDVLVYGLLADERD